MTTTIPSKAIETPALTRKDFVSDQEIRWCPGCGDYSILAQVQKVLPELGIPREKFVFVSGIGCSSRFPYYLDTYGFHSIHGRAAPIATGIKCANPDLSVWVATGDGDALSIGGNHMLHVLRRNVDINILLFNNRIYGLTKGQCSPTSEFGKQTKSTPYGSIEHPINPIAFALAAEATFIARSIDTDTHHLQDVLRRAARHRGVSFIEIFQNCNIFNDGAFEVFKDKTTKEDNILPLEQGKPMVFGKNRDKGIMFDGYRMSAVQLGNGISESDLMVHDAERRDSCMGYVLAQQDGPGFPLPIGVFRDVRLPTYDELLTSQIDGAVEKKGRGVLRDIIYAGQRWKVDNNDNSE